jgi:hypothetical protein
MHDDWRAAAHRSTRAHRIASHSNVDPDVDRTSTREPIMSKTYEQSEVAAAIERLIRYQAEANERNEWTFFVDSCYTPDAVYICEYGGTMLVRAEGIEQIKATHYGRDMQKGWEGWSFPYKGWAANGTEAITHWMNRGPGLRPDGSFYETHGISFLTYAGDGKFSHQYDLFDLAHQMKLCDELEAAGLLSPQLKQDWVIPMKDKLRKQVG